MCSFRLFANPYLYLLSGMSDNEIELIDKDHESLDSLQFKAKMSQDNQISISGVKILEYLWSKTKFSQQKSLFFDPNSKNFIEIYELYSDILDLLSLKMIPTDKIASISSSFKLLILNEDLIQSPPLTMILYECLHALKAIDPSFLEKNPPLKKLLLLIEINPLYQSWLFSSINLMKPIGIFLPSPLQSLKENIEENLSTFIDFASLNSALYSYQDKEKSYWDHIPFSGFPTMQIHKEELQKLREKCLVWNKLFDRMVRRISIFEHIFEELGQVDLFVNHLWRMSQKKKSLKKDNGLEFCIFRNDYLKDGILNQWKQVF